jgi:F-type H+-transporting ATPase subunit delta
MGASSSESRIIAARYAKALFDLSQENKIVDAVLADMQAVGNLIHTSKEFADMIDSPLLGRAQAATALEQILKKAKSSPITVQFFVRLAKNRRLNLTPLIIERLAFLVSESKGELTADIISATALSPAQMQSVSGALSKSTGRVVKLRTKENPDILGGLIVKLGGKMLDASIAGKLDRLKQVLR